MSLRRSTAINLAFHYASVGVVLLQGIVLVPLYLSRISVPLYGAWLATGNVLAWLELADPGLGQVLQQRVAHALGRDDRTSLPSVVGTGLLLGACNALLPLAFWPLAPWLATFVKLEGAERDALIDTCRIALVGTSLTISSYPIVGVGLALQLSLRVGTVHVAGSLAGLATTVALLVGGVGLPALPAGTIVRGAIVLAGNLAGVGAWWRASGHGRLRVTRAELRDIAGVTVFSFVSKVGSTLLGRVDALLVARMHSPTAAAVLNITGKALDPVRLATERVGTAMLPAIAFLAGAGDRAKVRQVSGAAGRAIAWGLAVGVASVIAFNDVFVRLWVGEKLYGGTSLTALLAVATGASVLAGFLSPLVFALGGIRETSATGIADSVVRIALQVVLVRTIGLAGVPIGALAATLLVSGLVLPTAAAARLGVGRGEQLRAWLASFGIVVVGAAVGAAAHLALPASRAHWGWPTFLVVASGFGATCAAGAIAVDPALRALVRSLASRGRLPAT